MNPNTTRHPPQTTPRKPGRPSDAELHTKRYTRKQIKQLAKRADEQRNPTLF